MIRPRPEPSQSVLDAAVGITAEPPTADDVAGTIGGQVVLEPDSAAAMGAKGLLPTVEGNTLLRDAGYIQMGLDPSDPDGSLTDPDPEAPGGGNGGEPTAPVNTAVPLVTQSGTTLSATMGIWEGEPTSYSYAWQINGSAVGTDAATYDVQPADVGMSATCTVTATNAIGSTTAPPSNSVTVA